MVVIIAPLGYKNRPIKYTSHLITVTTNLLFSLLQKMKLIDNIEKLLFWPGDNDKLHFAKRELLNQIKNLDISISGKGFFTVDRQFLAGVIFFN